MEYKENIKRYYDSSMAMLALIVVFILVAEIAVDLDSAAIRLFKLLDIFIWVIFCVDYFIRLFISKDKKKYLKRNVVDLLSILPLNSVFKTLRVIKIVRIVKITKLFRIVIFIGKFKVRINKFLKTNNFNYVIYLTTATIFIGAVGISILENMNFGNALWWSFVTTTTVGYGDISPATTSGRIIAVILMLVGIGFIGMLTGTISTFFLQNKSENDSYKESVINDIKNRLNEFDSISDEELKDMFKVLQGLKNEKSD